MLCRPAEKVDIAHGRVAVAVSVENRVHRGSDTDNTDRTGFVGFVLCQKCREVVTHRPLRRERFARVGSGILAFTLPVELLFPGSVSSPTGAVSKPAVFQAGYFCQSARPRCFGSSGVLTGSGFPTDEMSPEYIRIGSCRQAPICYNTLNVTNHPDREV